MKVLFNIKPDRGDYDANKYFTYGAEYQVLADYRNRQSGQTIRDNGFVVVDNTGQEQMLFVNQVKIIDDGKSCYIFS